MKKVDDVRHTIRSAPRDPEVVAKILDDLLQEANGSRRTLMSRETVAELLRGVATGEELAWARSMRRATATATRVQRPWLCVSG